MSPAPATPQPLDDLVEAFAQTAQAVIALGHGCGEQDLAQTTDCPGWTVHDQIAHVVGVEAWLEGHKDPRVDLPQYEHIRNELGKKVEYAVEVRRGRTGAEVVTGTDISCQMHCPHEAPPHRIFHLDIADIRAWCASVPGAAGRVT